LLPLNQTQVEGDGEGAQPGLLWQRESPRHFKNEPSSHSRFFAVEIWSQGALEIGPILVS
jgi:hypothetical protein